MTAYIQLSKALLAMIIGTIVYTRIIGLRSFAKMASIDFAITISIGSVIASTILSDSTSIRAGLFVLFLFFAFRFGIAVLTHKFDFLSKLFENKPLLLVKDGEILHSNLKKVRITIPELQSKLREANALNLNSVHAVVFETTGDVSVLHGDGELDWDLLNDVAE
jgi:uncharacterized membrane protein YcaP (DUF421 family)